MRWYGALLLGACGFSPGAAGNRASGGDAAVAVTDAPRDSSGSGALVADASHDAAQPCYGTGLGVSICLAQAPTQSLSVGFGGLRVVNTNSGSTDCVALVGPTANDYCVLAGTSIMITGTLGATGARPLVLVSLGAIDVTGTLDVASHIILGNRTTGAAADPSDCNGTAAGSTGGGFGGSFGTGGGNGGNAGNGGVASSAISPTFLRGGCPGSEGLDHTLASSPGQGGGAVDLIALGTITVSGKLDASGSGGAGAGITRNGGDGGGSGGMIVFDAPSLVVQGAMIFANGGGGGGGSTGDLVFGAGAGGGEASAPSSGGSAGTSPGTGGGGAGAHGAAPGQVGGDGSGGDGGGGGGGGVGVIRVFQAALPTGASVSPPFI